MSVSRMKVALTKSQSQRPCVSRKWMKEGLGRSRPEPGPYLRCGGRGATQTGPPSKMGGSQRGRWELGTDPVWTRVEFRESG